MEQLINLLKEIKPGVDFENCTSLIDDGYIASLDVVSIATAINDEFDVEITVVDIIPENFNSTEAMMKMIERLQDE